MERDADRNRSEEQAAWRDLVARLELPLPVDPARPPWPERENLGPATHAAKDERPGASTAGGTRADTSHASPGGLDVSRFETRPDLPAVSGIPGRPLPPSAPEPPADKTGTGRAAGSPGNAGARTGEHRRAPSGHGRAHGSHGRVIRPAVPSDTAPSSRARQGRRGDLSEDGHLDRADLDSRDRYIPPPEPSLPRSSAVIRTAWAALFGGPALLFLATMLGWNVPAWAELAAIVAFVAGFVVLVVRLGDGPSKGDGPDQGAVV